MYIPIKPIMKSKISAWGNSHGIRITTPVMEHLNVEPGDELNFKLTDSGLEIMKSTRSEEYVKAIAQDAIDGMIERSKPIKIVDDPYVESDIGYLVITINPLKPILREVPKETPGVYLTLADAKEAARQVLQMAIADAKKSLTSLRQIGVESITYLTL